MDLRVKKTKRAIRSAFYALIKEKPLEKITVREIAERAEINKTTFYAHYETVYDLADQLEKETVEQILAQIDTAQTLLEDPHTFVYKMYEAMQQYVKDFKMIPSSSVERFNRHLQADILKKIEAEGLDSTQYESVGAVLVFILNGLVGLLNTDARMAEQQLGIIADFVEAGIAVLCKP